MAFENPNQVANQVANQVIDECESTNDLAKRLAETGFSHGTWVSARRQSRGRGRIGRAWDSVEGNLFFSMISRIQTRELWTWIPLATAVAAVRAIQDVGVRGTRIKWPNDLWIGEAKLGGILCEGSASLTGDAYQVIGLGMNCLSMPENVTDQAVCSLSSVSGRRLSAEDLREPLRARLLEMLESLQEGGLSALREQYNEHAVFGAGSQVSWASGEQQGTVLGLGDSGELLVRTERGVELALLAEDVRIRRSS